MIELWVRAISFFFCLHIFITKTLEQSELSQYSQTCRDLQ